MVDVEVRLPLVHFVGTAALVTKSYFIKEGKFIFCVKIIGVRTFFDAIILCCIFVRVKASVARSRYHFSTLISEGDVMLQLRNAPGTVQQECSTHWGGLMQSGYIVV